VLLLLSVPAWAKPKKRPLPRPVPVEKPAENLPSLAPKEEPPPPPPPLAPPPPVVPPPKEEPPPKPDKVAIDLEALAGEYHALRDELFRSRAKAEMVGKQLYKTRMVATFQYKAQRA